VADPLADFPYILLNGDTPDADRFMADYQHIRTYLNARLGSLSSAQLLIANGSGQVVGRLISGDATVSNTGALTIADNAVNAAKIALGAVGSAELAVDAVQTAKIADDAVTIDKIGLAAVDSAQLVNLAVQTGKIADDAVTNAKVADNAVDTAQIAADAVTSPKLNLTTAADALGAGINPLPGALTQLCSVPVSNGTWLIVGQAHFRFDASSSGNNAHVSLTYNGAEHESDDISGVGDTVVPYLILLTITSGATVQLKAKNIGTDAPVMPASGLTRLTAVRLG
jgi:hypothetical protein